MTKPMSYVAHQNIQQASSALLNETAFARKPGPRSWFRRATRCGSARLMCWWSAIGCHCPCPPRRWPPNADPAEHAAWLEDMFLPPDAFDWPLNVLVVRSGEQTILVDAGLGGQSPVSRELGSSKAPGGRRHRSSVHHRRGHYAHAHGPCRRAARRRREDRLRPDVRIHVAAAEVAFWTAPDFSHDLDAWAGPRRAAIDRQTVRDRDREPIADLRGGARGGTGGARLAHRRPHTRA